jgi:hypothetical protein
MMIDKLKQMVDNAGMSVPENLETLEKFRILHREPGNTDYPEFFQNILKKLSTSN